MEEQKKRVLIYERISKIKIDKKEKEIILSDNYYLKPDFLGPSNNSPPNIFLIKLYNRYNKMDLK
jgi:hypothetical protein